jgi:hypothetical protein
MFPPQVDKSIINLLLIHRKAKNLVYTLQTIAFTNADLLLHRKAKNLVYLQTCSTLHFPNYPFLSS